MGELAGQRTRGLKVYAEDLQLLASMSGALDSPEGISADTWQQYLEDFENIWPNFSSNQEVQELYLSLIASGVKLVLLMSAQSIPPFEAKGLFRRILRQIDPGYVDPASDDTAPLLENLKKTAINLLDQDLLAEVFSLQMQNPACRDRLARDLAKGHVPGR